MIWLFRPSVVIADVTILEFEIFRNQHPIKQTLVNIDIGHQSSVIDRDDSAWDADDRRGELLSGSLAAFVIRDRQTNWIVLAFGPESLFAMIDPGIIRRLNG